MSGHTPGPLRAIKCVDPDDDMRCAVVAERGKLQFLVATIENGAPGDTCDTEFGNACLFSAAPELLDLLAEADRRIAWESVGLTNTFSDRVEAAIAKARGEA